MLTSDGHNVDCMEKGLRFRPSADKLYRVAIELSMKLIHCCCFYESHIHHPLNGGEREGEKTPNSFTQNNYDLFVVCCHCTYSLLGSTICVLYYDTYSPTHILSDYCKAVGEVTTSRIENHNSFQQMLNNEIQKNCYIFIYNFFSIELVIGG